MARSSCPKCDSYSFEIVEGTPMGSNYRLLYIQCSKCGAVVGVMDYFNIGNETHDLAKEIKELKRQNEITNNNLANVINIINQKLR